MGIPATMKIIIDVDPHNINTPLVSILSPQFDSIQGCLDILHNLIRKYSETGRIANTDECPAVLIRVLTNGT